MRTESNDLRESIGNMERGTDTVGLNRLFNLFSLIFIGISIIIVVLEYLTNRSLWADEVTLAYSILTRDLTNLTTQILKHRQSAPVLYVYIIKILTLIGDTSEFWLRIYSFLTYLGSLFLIHRILKDLAKVRFPQLGAAYAASMMIMLYFANEFKQYMSDAFTVLLVIYLYERYIHEKLTMSILFALYAIILWLSFPAIFYIGGVAIVIFIRSIIKKNRQKFFQSTIGSLAVIGSFLWQYFVWLKKASENPDLIEHWEFYKFPILPTSLDDLVRGARLIYGLTLSINDYPDVDNVIRVYPIIVAILMAIGVLSLFKIFNEATLVLVSGTIVMMMASFIGKYPFHPRLVLFLYPIIAILAIIAIDFLSSSIRSPKWQNITLVILTLILFSGNLTSLSLFDPDNRLRKNEESKPLILYVKENIQPGEFLYVSGADMSLRYLNGYENSQIGDQVDPAIDNIRFGLPSQEATNDFSIEVYASSNAYLLISHANQEKIRSIVEPLISIGYLEKIMEVAETPLFYHARDLEFLHVKVQYKLLDYQMTDQTLSGLLEITNIGQSYLNAAELPPVVLASRTVESFQMVVAEKNIRPGQTIQIAWSMPIDQNATEIDLQLRYTDQYWFDQLNMAPIEIILPIQ